MKHILFGLAAVLFASSVALADDQLTAQVKPASAEATQPSAKVPSGADADVHTANSESAASAEKPAPTGERGIGPFSLGMSEDEAKALGAKPTDNADMLQLPFKWMEADWTCVVQGDCGNPVCEYERSAPRAGVRRPARPGLYADNRAARDGPCRSLSACGTGKERRRMLDGHAQAPQCLFHRH